MLSAGAMLPMPNAPKTNAKEKALIAIIPIVAVAVPRRVANRPIKSIVTLPIGWLVKILKRPVTTRCWCSKHAPQRPLTDCLSGSGGSLKRIRRTQPR